MADLTPYRGKRALVCGIPRGGAKTQQVWLDATGKALRTIGIAHATTYQTTCTVRATRKAISIVSADVLIACRSTFPVNIAREAAKAAGVPVLRVRRDGTIDVDASDE